MPYALFGNFDVRMTKADAMSCSHQGRCDDDVDATVGKPYIRKQLDAIGPDAIRAELRGYGAWDAGELADDTENRKRLVWIAAGDIREELAEKARG